jgi:hypothetical protein
MFGKNTKEEEKKFARLISQECKYAKYSETEILEVARTKAKKYGDAALYLGIPGCLWWFQFRVREETPIRL